MNILITGITGFAGSHLADLLLSKKGIRHVYGFHRVGSRLDNLKHLGGRVRLRRCDLTKAAQVKDLFKKIRPDRVYHLAGQSYSAGSPESASDTLRENILGGLHILEAARTSVPKARLLMVGSSEEYGDGSGKKPLLDENTELKPLTPYGVSKVAVDHLTYQYYRHYKLFTIRARPFNHTGPRQRNLFSTSSFAEQVARIEAGVQRPPVIRTGNLGATRDFTDVRDVVRAYWLLLEKGVPGEAYNICSGRKVSMRTLLDIYLENSQMKIKIQKDASRFRTRGVSGLTGDFSKLERTTGWQPAFPIERTLLDLLDHWREKVARSS